MGEIQLWQSDGLGADKSTLENVIQIFKSDGVQNAVSQQALNNYIKKLSDSSLRDMFEMDKKATIQILAGCFGISKAFDKAICMTGWISPEAYTEVVEKYEERTKKLEDERDMLLSKCEIEIQRTKAVEKQCAELKDILVHYKADLYDFYVQAGKLPNYERG